MFYDKIIIISVGGNFMSDVSLRKAMDNAEASMNMEGLQISAFAKELCEKLLKKEITFEEYMRRIIEA